ncbi:MAG TPA: hypothetical protein PKV72_02110 [Candidatus Peribacteria bacterium]|nr:hypothetical protein [Candidatus Peribacteria bacterium]
MKTANNKQVVLLPKGAVTEGKDPRNPVLDLLTRAGYDKIRSGFDPKARNRTDEVTQGDFLFRAVKGAPALAAQFELFRDETVGILTGSDIVGEADQRARQYGVRADISKLLSLGIGPCTLQLLAPDEQRVFSPEDVDGRLIFTKYPYLGRSVLRASGRNAAIRTSDGADTRVTDYRPNMPGRSIGALEIVGSGETARANRLQIVGNDVFPYPSGADMDMPYLNLLDIRTDLFMTNAGRISQRSRQMLRELGLALESAKETNQYVAFTFNIPADQVSRFADLGMKGPSIMGVATRDGSEWRALQVYAPIARKNAMRAELMRRGAQDLSVGETLQVEVAADKSEVLNVLPFAGDASPEAAEIPDRNGEVADWLMGLRDTIAERAATMNDPLAKPSSTIDALKQGLRFCVDRYGVEMAELSRAVRRGDREEIIVEAGQAVYWLMVSLQSRGLRLEEVINDLYRPEKEESEPDVPDLEPGIEWRSELEGNVRRLRAAVRNGDMLELNGMGYLINEGVNTASVSLVDRATELNTAFRSSSDLTAIQEAADALSGIVCLCEMAGVSFDEVMDKEMGK